MTVKDCGGGREGGQFTGLVMVSHSGRYLYCCVQPWNKGVVVYCIQIEQGVWGLVTRKFFRPSDITYEIFTMNRTGYHVY